MSSLLILCAKKMADHQNVYPIKPELQTRESFCRLRSRDSHCNHLVHLEHKTMKKHLQIRTLMIHKGENMETTLFRLEKDWILRFVLGPTLQADTVRIFTNHPENDKQAFKRDQYHELQWESPCSTKSDRHDAYVDVHIVLPGSFNYYFTIDNSDSILNANGKGYFLVDPVLLVGTDEELTMDCLQCQTVLAKSLGPFAEWKSRLEVAKQTGYNMIHFTPLQELGVSNSSYSIRNQLKVNPIFSEGIEITFDEVESFTRWLNKEWKILTASDLVFNHTSKCSSWLREHPECAYNLQNSPHLKPAFIVDRIFHYFSLEVCSGQWTNKGVPPEVNTEHHLNAIKHALHTEVFPKYRVYEFFLCDVDEALNKFKQQVKAGNIKPIKDHDLEIIPEKTYQRLKGTVDPEVAMGVLNFDKSDIVNFDKRLEECCQVLREKLNQKNKEKRSEITQHIDVAINNFLANVRYRFLAPDGPKIRRVTADDSLMHDYFVVPAHLESCVHNEEKMIFSDNAKFVMACNGWVMGDNPLRNFAEAGSQVYIRRELIAWGDSVKLRYGKQPEDCPYLWNFMKQYTEISARFADALRLDNCHSTPMHVAEYMLDAARAVRPNLYVIAELFTSSEATDNLFMNHLGINSLIRESLVAWNSHELGRLVHRFGGQPVGSFIQPQIQPLVNTMAHAIFFDQTHDNPSPIEKRSVYDVLPTAALISMACCASGSNRGYDELVPHHIHVVNENRLYSNFSARSTDTSTCGLSSGIILGKKVLNQLHYLMACNGYSQTYVDQINEDVVCVTRHNPSNHESVVLIARTSFSFPSDPSNRGTHIHTIHLPGVVDEVIFEMKLVHREGCEYHMDHEYINGLPDYRLNLVEHIKINFSEMIKVTKSDKNCVEINFKNFPPSSVIAIKMSLPPQAKDCILKVRSYLNEFGYLMRSYSGRSLFNKEPSSFREIIEHLNYDNLNRVMYRVAQEEENDGLGISSYEIPKYGHLNYCGLQGIAELLDKVRTNNDLGHPLCDNLREGDWFCDYIVKRLEVHDGTKLLGEWFGRVFAQLKMMPRYLIPSYFDAIVSGAFILIQDHALELMSPFIQQGSSFVQALSLCSIQFCGFVKNAELPPLADDLEAPRPNVLHIDDKGRKHQDCLSLCAGLPHFASGFARNWGRDTFIAIRGNLLLTGRFKDARYMILAYGGCLRHGLIPNLLLEGEGARYNCRDAYWWWLQCIQDYCKLAPNGTSLLKDKVARLYPADDSEAKIKKPEIQLLSKVIQEGLSVHAHGLKFRERNAGHKIDMHMSDEGFNNSIGIDWKTGFVFGGNIHNCGTWMDMMGSSEKAGTRGQPATPRDGSAVELVALCYSAITWLNKMNNDGHYRYSSVKRRDGKDITFSSWADLIRNNFEKFFWVHRNPTPDIENFKYINRKGIYKDSVGASQPWCDFQLRPNFPIAMVVAPNLFSPEKAWYALTVAENILLGPLGMKTLDTNDWNYAGVYDNTNDSNDTKVAKGFNYHNGPEWVWPVGFFFRAKLYFANILDKTEPGTLKKAMNEVKICLTKHYQHLLNSPWKSLPELTNENGAHCPPSCQAQAWSVSTILETLYDMEYMV
ncbi:glycogen debranching enzyme isoform X2 [Octopus bimaculoides]|uniref:glycogen debranching enzyme isoform X2 n=2 Tax=Octopus bimaculoides TaxID=37653 RepID=UPI0022E8056A|nr:glycogen debranching enzyme isoform X2 [Octopus bimaculoides]